MSGICQCQRNASHYSNHFDHGPPPAQRQIQDMLRNKVRKLYNKLVSNNQNKSECIDKFTQDIDLVQLMKSPATFGVMDVSVLDDNLVRIFGSPLCHQISVVQQ